MTKDSHLSGAASVLCFEKSVALFHKACESHVSRSVDDFVKELGKITTTVEEYGEYRSTIKKRCATLEEEYGAFLQKKRARLNSSKAAQGGNGIRGMFSAMRAAAAAEGGGAAAAAAAAADDQEA